MSRRRRKSSREKNLTSSYFSGDIDEDRVEPRQRFTEKSKHAQQDKMERTAVSRAIETEASGGAEDLPLGQVIQVHSLYCQVEHQSGVRLCVVRKTLSKLSDTSIVVGDVVRFRDIGSSEEPGRPEAVIEQVLPRKTVLTRAGSFHSHRQQPIVANAQQMLIVTSVAQPKIKWGLIDRMLVAAQSGGLTPIICLNKIDLADSSAQAAKQLALARQALAHYAAMGITTLQASATRKIGIDALAAALTGLTTVLAGHSGVGKSTLIDAIQGDLNIRMGQVRTVTEKGRHTTSSAQRYRLDIGAYVIDTPGIKQFGLWGVTAERLADYFPDIQNGTAPPWRIESHDRIAQSL